MRWIALIWVVALVACTANPSPTATIQPVESSPTVPPSHTLTAAPSDTSPPTPAPSAAPSATITPGPPEPITPENSKALRNIKTIQFNAWEMVMKLAWAPDGGLLAVSAGEHVYLYNAGTFSQQIALEAGVWSPGLAFSPDSRLIASGGRDGSLRMWEATTGLLRFSIQAHKKGINSVSFHPSGESLASAGNDGMVRIWESGSGSPVSEMIGGSFGIPAIAFTPDGSGLAIANGDVVRFRRTQDGTFMQTLRGEGSFYCLAQTRDGRILGTGGSDNSVSLWELETGEILHYLEGHTGEVNRQSSLVWSVAFNPDGRLLASAGGDQTVRLWDVASGELLATLTGHSAAVTSLAFSPDGLWLASGGLDGRVILWGG